LADKAEMLLLAGRSLFILTLVIAAGAIAPSSATAKSLAQFLYEDHIGHKCQQSTAAEVDGIAGCLGNGAHHSPERDLDRVAEYAVLKPIAEDELAQLTCLGNQIQALNDNYPSLNVALHDSCKTLAQLRDIVQNEEFLNHQISSHKEINDRYLRRIPDDEFNHTNQLIQQMEKKLAQYKDIEDTIRSTDFILSSPTIYAEVRKQFETGYVLSADTAERTCSYLRLNAKKWLSQDLASIESSKVLYQKNLGGDWAGMADDDFKHAVWNSGSKIEIVKKLANTGGFQDATYCRLEGEYGESRGIAQRMGFVGATGLFSILGIVASPIAGAAAKILDLEGAGAAAFEARVVSSFNLIPGAASTARQVFSECREKISAVTDHPRCTNPIEAKSLIYQKLAAAHCVSSGANALLAMALPAISIKGVGALSKAEESLESELSQREKVTAGLLGGAGKTSGKAATVASTEAPSTTTTAAQEVIPAQSIIDEGHRRLDALVKRGLLDRVDSLFATELGRIDKVDDLYMQGKIGKEDYDAIQDAFLAFDLDPTGAPAKVLDLILKNANSGREFSTRVLSVPCYGSENETAMAFKDAATGKAIGYLDYSIKGKTLSIDSLSVVPAMRGNGYSEALFAQVLKENPQITKIVSTMSGTNEKALQHALTIPLDQSKELTPAYKSRMALGFTNIKLQYVERTLPDGSKQWRYEMTAKRP
jgi:hypothetical protein